MKNYTVLIIDYDPVNIERLTDYLENAGLKVEAADGVQGIEAFRRIRPVLCLIEATLPRRSGLEVCRELKDTPHGAVTRIVIMDSRFRNRAYRLQCLNKFGADDYAERPVSTEKLDSILEVVLAESRADKENRETEIVNRLDDAISGLPVTSNSTVQDANTAQLKHKPVR